MRAHRLLIPTIASLTLVGCQDIAQGSGDDNSGSDEDFLVAQPVPMALMDPEFLTNNTGRLEEAGNSGDYDTAKDEYQECGKSVDPMDTGVYQPDEANPENLTFKPIAPPNLCISTNIMSVPGYAGGQMRTLLKSIESISDRLFGKNGFFAGGVAKTKRYRNIYDAHVGRHELDQPSYLEIIFLYNPDAKPEQPRVYQVDFYYPATDPADGEPTSFVARTSMRLEPLSNDDNEEYAVITANHFVKSDDGSTGHFLKAIYNTKTKEFTVDFGTSPVDPEIPAKTTLKWTNQDNLLTISGAYVWKNASGLRPSKPNALPEFYQPYEGDVTVFQSITDLTRADTTAESVQRMAHIPASDGKIAVSQATSGTWDRANSGYFKQMSRYLVGLLRQPGASSDCSHLKSTIITAIQNSNKTVPVAITNIPQDDLCVTNSMATDQHVETLLTEACQVINIIQPLCLTYTNSTTNLDKVDCPANPTPGTQLRKVSLCTKLAEALYLDNPQLLYTAETETGERGRTPAIAFADQNPAYTVAELVQKFPDGMSIFRELQDKLTANNVVIDLTGLSDLSWPEPEIRDRSYFANARGQR